MAIHLGLSPLTRTAWPVYNLKDVDKPKLVVFCSQFHKFPPGDKIIAVAKGMWEVLSDSSLVRLEITFQCVNEDHHRLLAHGINLVCTS